MKNTSVRIVGLLLAMLVSLPVLAGDITPPAPNTNLPSPGNAVNPGNQQLQQGQQMREQKRQEGMQMREQKRQQGQQLRNQGRQERQQKRACTPSNSN